jgi:hypothetical protein
LLTHRCLLLLLLLLLLQVLNLKMNCTDVVLSPQVDAAALQRTLYCGYYQARCNGSTATSQ